MATAHENPVWDWLRQLSQGDEYARWHAWQQLTAEPDRLALACRQAVTAEADLLTTAWQQVRAPSVTRFVRDYLYRPGGPAASIDAPRLLAALDGTVAAGLVARAVRAGDGQALLHWLTECVAAWTGEPVRSPPAFAIAPGDATESMWKAALQWLGSLPAVSGAVRDSVQSMLERPRPIVRRRTTPILGHREPAGFVASLQVELVAEGTGCFYPDPVRMGLLPVTSSFLASVQMVWGVVRGLAAPAEALRAADVRWWLRGSELTLLDGGSLGAALAVALLQLLRDEPLDDACAISAAVAPDGSLVPVGHVRAKVAAALAAGRITRVVVHPDNRSEAWAAFEAVGHYSSSNTFPASGGRESPGAAAKPVDLRPPLAGSLGSYSWTVETASDVETARIKASGLATTLAVSINDHGWDAAMIDIAPGRSVPVAGWLERKAWQRDWEPVLILLAGMLERPGPLLEMLTDHRADDHFRHRLALAARCLDELTAHARLTLTPLVDRITTDLLSCWALHVHHGRAEVVRHLTASLRALGRTDGRMNGIPLDQWLLRLLDQPATRAVGLAAAKHAGIATRAIVACLLRLLCEERGSTRLSAAEALAACGGAMAPDQVDSLGALLDDPDWRVRRAAAMVVCQCPAVSTHPSIPQQLVARLRDEEEEVRQAAADAIGVLRMVAPPDMFENLAALLFEPGRLVRQSAARVFHALAQDSWVGAFLQRQELLLGDADAVIRRRAVWTVGQLGQLADRGTIPDQLLDMLTDVDPKVRQMAAVALGHVSEGLGPHRPERLAGLLRSERPEVRAAALEAVTGLGSAAGHMAILDALLAMIDTRATETRCAALGAGAVGRTAEQPSVLRQLDLLLDDPDPVVQTHVACTIGRIGASAMAGPVIARLVELTESSEPDVQINALLALGELGAAVRPECLDRYACLLGSPEPGVRWAAATAIVKSGKTTPHVLEQVLLLLRSTESPARWAAYALTGLAGNGVTPTFLDGLLHLLMDSSPRIRRNAAEMVGRLGCAAARPDIVSQLMGLLEDEENATTSAESPDQAGAHAIGILLHQGIRIFSTGEGWRVCTVRELSE